MPSSILRSLAEQAMAAARRRGLSIVTAESCTAGALSTLLSEAPGAAEHLQGGFVTYTKANKTKSLGVPSGLLRSRGAVCAEVARAMAEGALAHSAGDLAVAITGVAGPEPDEDNNPVGLVCIAVAQTGRDTVDLRKEYGAIGRDQVRARAMEDALREVIRTAEAE